MTVQDAARIEAVDLFADWVDQFGAALTGGDVDAFVAHFAQDAYWRDILAFDWDFRTMSGPDEIRQLARAKLAEVAPGNFRVAAHRFAARFVKRSARQTVEGYFDFETNVGHGTGFVRLLFDPEQPSTPQIWLLLTTLQEIRGHEEQIGERRPSGTEYSLNFSGDNWLDQRIAAQSYTEHAPQVLIVGGGQSGLALAARLAQIGVDALIVEANPRIGDNWRNRYHSLTLHNEVWANSLPYLEFPPNWPNFVPKDKLAGWLESYAEFMELNVWTGTRFLDSQYDVATRTWIARLECADGSHRDLRVPHLVLATGAASGAPHIPELSGLAGFTGEVMHSTQFSDGRRYAGRRALVIGTGNSGHDVAQDLYSNGAQEVTIVQRSATCVVSLVPSGTLVYALYSEEPSIEDIDLITAAIPYPVLRDTYQWITRRTCELDKELLDRLTAVGFELDFEPDHTGFHMKYLRHGGGYYINVGCADLIADGKIGLLKARDIETFTADGVRLADGSSCEFDLVVLATGYENLQEGVRRLLGDDIADRIGPVWGFDEQGFMRNMWNRTAQDRFWLMGGALMECRLYSRFLALLIKADLEGILPPR